MRTGWAVIAVDNSSMPAVWEWTLPPHSVKPFTALHHSFQSVAFNFCITQFKLVQANRLQQCTKNESSVLTAIYFPDYRGSFLICFFFFF